MTTIQFYHLTATPLERALPKLLEKVVAGGFKTLLLAGSDERVEHLNQLLWTYDQNSFLPHGSLKDGNTEQQPVLLLSALDSLSPSPSGLNNMFNLLAITDGTMPEQLEQFERILYIFNGNDQESLEKARAHWTSCKNTGHSISYLRQSESGGWEQKAVA